MSYLVLDLQGWMGNDLLNVVLINLMDSLREGRLVILDVDRLRHLDTSRLFLKTPPRQRNPLEILLQYS